MIDGVDPRGGAAIAVPDVWDAVQVRADARDVDVLRTGVGKAAAAGAVGLRFDPGRHMGVLSIGIAGALPGAGLEIGSAVLANPSVLADEGSLTPGGFLSLDAMGFGADTPAVRPDDASRSALTPLVDLIGPVATVSVCSGTDAWAASTADRSRDGGDLGLAEAMEGAAAGLAARRIDPAARFAELRVISNTTGHRERQTWDLELGLAALQQLAGLAVRSLGAGSVR